MQPFGAYDGIVIHFQAVKCVGFNRQVPRESSPPTIHKGGASWYKHFTCGGLDRSGRTWTWFAHGHKTILEFSYLDCYKGGSGHPCPT